jgi:hypothetical protein
MTGHKSTGVFNNNHDTYDYFFVKTDSASVEVPPDFIILTSAEASDMCCTKYMLKTDLP